MTFKVFVRISALCVLALSGCQREGSLREARDNGVSFRYDAGFFKSPKFRIFPKETLAEYGAEKPFEHAPASVEVKMELIRPLPNNVDFAELYVMPLVDPFEQDFESAYPFLAGAAKYVRSTLANRPPDFDLARQEFGEVPEWRFLDMSHAFYAKMQYFENPWFTGIAYVTQYVHEVVPITNVALCFRLVGISRDGRYYVHATVPLRHPSLPEEDPGEVHDSDAILKDNSVVAQRLDGLPENSFEPSLTSLKDLFLSLALDSGKLEKTLAPYARPSMSRPGE